MKIHRIEIRPIYADLDAMNIVYNGTYLRFFEYGRTELMRATGIPYTVIEEQGLHFPVTEANVRFRQPAHYDELLYLDTWISWMKKVSLRFQYRLCRPEGDSLVELVIGFTTHGCITHQGRVSPLPAMVSEALRPYVSFKE